MKKIYNTYTLIVSLNFLLYIGQLLCCHQIHVIIQLLKKLWFLIDSHAKKLCKNTSMEHEIKMYMLLPLSFTLSLWSLLSYVNIPYCPHIIPYLHAHCNLYIANFATISTTEEEKEVLSTTHDKTQEQLSNRYSSNH